MELGISRGRFSVIRVKPNPEAPTGAFVIRITDAESGIVVTTMLATDQGLEFAQGFRVSDDEHTVAPAIVLPDPGDVRVLGGDDANGVEPPA